MKSQFLLILLLITTVLPQDFSYDVSEYEKLKNIRLVKSADYYYPGDSNFDVVFYRLNLNITYRPDYLTGEVAVNALSNADNLSSIFLDLSSVLIVDSVISGDQHLAFTHNKDKLLIDIDPKAAGEEIGLLIYYRGIPGSDGSGSFTFGEHNGMPSIFNLSEPYGASDWWPCKDTPADKADSSEVWLTVRNDLTAVSNGTLGEVTDNGNTKTYKWKNHYPIAHYLISAAISNYSEYLQYFSYPFNNLMPVVHYIYPEHLEAVKPELDKTITMLDIFSSLFGQYPFLDEKYGHAEFGWGGGMEHQTISSMGSFNEILISHELAHQWFGDKITCRDWHNIWLNEGFATYATGLYYEKNYNYEAYQSYMEIQTANAKNAEGTLYVQDISSVSEIFNGLRSYSKGAVVLHMLRGVTGDSLFFNILKTYADHPALRYGTAVTEDFRETAETIYGRSLEYFFDQWVYGVKFPKYIGGWDAGPLRDNYKIVLNIEQQLNDSPSYFTMPLQIRIKTNNGDTTVVVFNDRQVQQFEIIVSGEPKDLIVDPDNYIMKEILYTNSGHGQLPEFFLLEQNYPNPFNEGTVINFSVPANNNAPVKIRLFDITGKEIGLLFNSLLPAGQYSIPFNASGLSSGIYIYALEAGGVTLSRKMTLLK